MKIVLDTNVLISAIVFGGKPREVLDLIIRGRVDLAMTEDLLMELRGVLEGRKFGFPPSVTQMILGELTSTAEMVAPLTSLHVVREDPEDNRVLECAVEAKADAIISGDSHLLSLKSFRGIPILPPGDFLERF